MKGTERNLPCKCGSGVKAKRCDCRGRAEEARLKRGCRVVDTRPRFEVDAPRLSTRGALAIMLALSAPPPVRR